MPNLASLLFLVAMLALWPARASAADPDPFWGPDKLLHFTAAGAIAASAYAATTAATPDRWKALTIGGGLAIGAGALKEGLDAAGLGDPSWKDFAWDAIGAVCGLSVAFLVDAGVRGGRWPPLSSSISAKRGAALSIGMAF
jgi:putative lipoprotein